MTPREFFNYLQKNAKGEANGRHAQTLKIQIGVDDRACRELAFACCEAGNPVCTSEHGYFVPATKAEGFRATERLESQAKAMLSRVSATRKALERVFGPADLFPKSVGVPAEIHHQGRR